MNSDSGVVTRMCGGRFTIRWRSDAGVSPVRTAVRIAGSRSPRSAANACNSRQRNVEVLVNIVAERLQGRHIQNLRRFGQAAVQSRSDQIVEADQKRSESLA